VTIGGGGAGGADDGSVRGDCTPGNAEVELFCFPPSSDVSYPFMMSAFRFKYRNAADPARTVSAAAINTHGVAVGTRITCHPDPRPFAVYQKIGHAFSYVDGVFTLLSDHSSRAIDINDKGTILGVIDAQTVLWRDGGIVWLPGNSPIAINEYDQVLMQDGLRGALWADDVTTEIGDYIRVFDLNDEGEVIGMHTDLGASSLAFVWKDGVFHDLPPLAGDSGTRAEAINNQGQVVGFSSGDQISPVIWENGIPRLIWPQPVDSGLMQATDINDAGAIVGTLREGTFSYSSGTLVGVGGLEERLHVNDNGVIFGPRFIWSHSCYDICCSAALRR